MTVSSRSVRYNVSDAAQGRTASRASAGPIIGQWVITAIGTMAVSVFVIDVIIV